MAQKGGKGSIETSFKKDISREMRIDAEEAYKRVKTAFDLASVDLKSMATELPKLSIKAIKFADFVVASVYRRILFTVMRSMNLDETKKNQVFYTCMNRYSPQSKGLITYVSDAIARKERIVLRKTRLSDGSYTFEPNQGDNTPEEIDGDPNLIEIDFTQYHDSDLIRLYSMILYDSLLAVFRGVKMSSAILLGLAGLREMLETDENSEAVLQQVLSITHGIKSGGTSVTDADSNINFVTYDVEPSGKVKEFVYQQYSNVTGFAVSFFNGTGGSSLSDTGLSDDKMNRKASEFYFYEILNPILSAVFDESFDLKPDVDISEITNVLSTIEYSEVLSEKGRLFLANQVGLSAEHLELNDGNTETQENADSRAVNTGTGDIEDSQD